MPHGLSGPRPAALRDAELVYMERLFRASARWTGGEIDRAYRLPSGLLVLVESKTRWATSPACRT